MMTFLTKGKLYRGSLALEIVRALEAEARDYPFQGQSVRQFLSWSLSRSANGFPPRELDLSNRIEDEALALNYLYLCDEYGVGELSGKPYSGAE